MPSSTRRRRSRPCAARWEPTARWRSIASSAGGTRLLLNRTRTATVRPRTSVGGRPAADAGPDARVATGASVRLDGRASCHPDRAALTPRWELVSAPAGSSWTLTGADGWSPMLRADRPGPYRVRLVVTDPQGRASSPDEVLVKAGPRCADGIDDDVDGLIDTDDPDCDTSPTPPGGRGPGCWAQAHHRSPPRRNVGRSRAWHPQRDSNPCYLLEREAS